jgi:hypothetical protein
MKKAIIIRLFSQRRQYKGYNNMKIISVAKNHKGAEGWPEKYKNDKK